MNRIFYVLLGLTLFGCAAGSLTDDILDDVYGPIAGCIETSVGTTTPNRSIQLEAYTRYWLYGTDTGTLGTYETIKCAQGGSNVDVNNLPNSLVGIELAEKEKIIVDTGSAFRYVSCISANASMYYHLCKANP